MSPISTPLPNRQAAATIAPLLDSRQEQELIYNVEGNIDSNYIISLWDNNGEAAESHSTKLALIRHQLTLANL
jgi:hypothetical protein